MPKSVKPSSEKSPSKKPAKKKLTRQTAGKIALIVLLVVAALVLLCIGAYHMILDYYLDKINIVTTEDLHYATEPIRDTETKEEELPTTEEPPETMVGDPELWNQAGLPLIRDTNDVMNILLIGIDARDRNSYSRSDTMILLSINTKTKKVIMTSFLRDILVKIPDRGFDRFSHTFAYGGPQLLIKTFKANFNIEIQHYAYINFFSFVDIVDALGGLDVTMTANEVSIMNFYLLEINELYGRPVGTDNLPAVDGTYHLNGKQALGYARNRYSGGDDWGRTQRQQNLMKLMMEKVKKLSLSQIDNLLETVLPLITTNMQKSELKSLVNKSLTYLGYERVSQSIPIRTGNAFQYATFEGMDILNINYKENCDEIYRMIYGEEPPEN